MFPDEIIELAAKIYRTNCALATMAIGSDVKFMPFIEYIELYFSEHDSSRGKLKIRVFPNCPKIFPSPKPFLN